MSTFESAHSPAMYKLDEAISALRCCIRQCMPSRALFWASQVLLGGQVERLAVKVLPQIASEDVGFGWAPALFEAVAIYSAWKRGQNVDRAVLTLVLQMTQCYKNRIVASAARSLESLDVVPDPLKETQLTGGGFSGVLDALGDAIHSKHERRALQLAHVCYLGIKQSQADTELYAAQWRQAWAILQALPHVTTDHEKLTRTLFAAHRKGLGSSRALWFQAVLLHFYSDETLWDVPEHQSAHLIGSTLADMKAKPRQRPYEITCDMLDATTERGRGVSTLHYIELDALLYEWSNEEIGKSHGGADMIPAASTKIHPLCYVFMRPESKVFDPYEKGASAPIVPWSADLAAQLQSKWAWRTTATAAAVETKKGAAGVKRKATEEEGEQLPAAKRQRSRNMWCGWEARDMAATDAKRVSGAILWRPSRPHAPSMHVGSDGLWQGPFDTIKESDRNRLRDVLERTRQLQDWGVHTLTIQDLWLHDDDVWIQFELPFTTPRADWRAAVARNSVGAETVIFDLASVHMVKVTQLAPSVWTDKPQLLASMLVASCALARLGCAPGSLVALSSDSSRVIVAGVDDARGCGPILQAQEDKKWHELLFCHANRELVDALAAGVARHRFAADAAVHALEQRIGGGELWFLLPPSE